jgi:threonylcarbamoyladenosine tRNA methylthiotransferase MtaB
MVKDYNITKVHAFPFSAHTMGESVPAGKFKNQVPEHIKKDRMNRLMKLSEEIREDFKTSQK